MSKNVHTLIEFLQNAPSTYHAVAALAADLRAAGFAELQEGQRWQLQPGGSYYVTRNQTALIAFRLPEVGFAPFNIVSAHSDSPGFRLKANAEIELKNYTQLNTGGYGGLIISSWLDRPLSVAGRVLVKTASGLKSQLVNVDRDLLLIPNLAIHMNREINDGYKFNLQKDTLPLIGSKAAKGSLMAQVAEAAGVAEADIVDSDLYLYNRDRAAVWGADGEYFSCRRLDDLECAWGAVQGLIDAAAPKAHIAMAAIFDNEEVGSGTRQGADSTFLTDVTERIAHAFGADKEAQLAAHTSSLMVSADNAHASHPNHPEKDDPTNHVLMNGGVVIKYNPNQKYASDAVSAGLFRLICGKAGVPVQAYANRSDIGGGSTLGNISTAHLSIPTVDIGMAQLAMHSCYETGGSRDVEYLLAALTAFYATDLASAADGEWQLA